METLPEPKTEKYQQLYNMLLDAIPSTVLLVDKHLRITSANRNFLEKSQRTLVDTIGRRLEDVFPPIIVEQTNFKERINEVFEQQKPVREQRITYRAQGIPLHTYHYSILPILCDATDRHVMLLMEDVTEQVRLSEEVLRSQKLAALGVMAGGIAHEIRNPLAVCSSAAQFLQEDHLPVEFRVECAEKIQVGIQKVSTIIENLLRFSRPSAITETVQVNLVSVLGETLALIANQARVQNIRMVRRFPEHNVFVCGVPSLLQQVFVNLCLNAINAMPDGGTLSITLEDPIQGKNALEKSDVEAVVRVEDTGVGIPEASIDKIFDPFHTTSPVGNGTGLGLSICYSIVKQHQGTIVVESRHHKGSVFTVKLPLS